MGHAAPLVGPRFRVSGLDGGWAVDGVDPQEAQLRAGMRPGDDGYGVDPARGGLLPGDYLAFYLGVLAWARGGAPPPVDPEDAVRVIDCMPPRGEAPDVVRVVRGLEGRVPIEMDLLLRFDYGRSIPWMRRVDGVQLAVAGPDAVRLDTPVDVRGEDFATRASFAVGAGEEAPFVLTWFPSHQAFPDPVDAADAI